jgi:hypothetical protein
MTPFDQVQADINVMGLSARAMEEAARSCRLDATCLEHQAAKLRATIDAMNERNIAAHDPKVTT